MPNPTLPASLLGTPVCLSRCKKKEPLPDPTSAIHIQISNQLRSLVWTHFTEMLSDLCLNPAAAPPASQIDDILLAILDSGVPPSGLAAHLRAPMGLQMMRTDLDETLAIPSPLEGHRGRTVGRAVTHTVFVGVVTDVMRQLASSMRTGGGGLACLHELLSERGSAILALAETKCSESRATAIPPMQEPADHGALIDQVRVKVSRRVYKGAEWKKSSVWRTQVREAVQVYDEVTQAVHRDVWSEGIDVRPFKQFIMEICPVVQLLALTIEDVAQDPLVAGRLAAGSPAGIFIRQCADFCLVPGAISDFIRRREEGRKRVAKATKEAAREVELQRDAERNATATSNATTSTLPLASTISSTSIPATHQPPASKKDAAFEALVVRSTALKRLAEIREEMASTEAAVVELQQNLAALAAEQAKLERVLAPPASTLSTTPPPTSPTPNRSPKAAAAKGKGKATARAKVGNAPQTKSMPAEETDEEMPILAGSSDDAMPGLAASGDDDEMPGLAASGDDDEMPALVPAIDEKSAPGVGANSDTDEDLPPFEGLSDQGQPDVELGSYPCGCPVGSHPAPPGFSSAPRPTAPPNSKSAVPSKEKPAAKASAAASKGTAPTSKASASTSKRKASTSKPAAASKPPPATSKPAAASNPANPSNPNGTTSSRVPATKVVPPPRPSPVAREQHRGEYLSETPHLSQLYKSLPHIIPPMTCLHVDSGQQPDPGGLVKLEDALVVLFLSQFAREMAKHHNRLVGLMRDRAFDQLLTDLDAVGSLDLLRADLYERIGLAVRKGLLDKIRSPAVQASFGHQALVKSFQDSIVALSAILPGKSGRTACLCELSVVADEVVERARASQASAVLKLDEHIDLEPMFDPPWADHCFKSKRQGKLKAACWSGQYWRDDVADVMDAFSEQCEACLYELNMTIFTAGYAETIDWMGGLRVYEEAVKLGSTDYVPVFSDDYSALGGDVASDAPLKHWADLVFAAIVAAGEGRPISLSDAAHWKEEGDQLFEKGHYTHCIAKYSQAIAADPLNISARTNCALARLKIGTKLELQAAVPECTSALFYSRENVKAWYRRGVALSRLKLYGAAMKDLNVAIGLDPDNSAAHEELASARAGAAGQTRPPLVL